MILNKGLFAKMQVSGSPTQIGGASLDLDSTAGVLKSNGLGGFTAAGNTDVALVWQDQSGNGNDAIAEAGTTPIFITGVINGLPVVRFAASGSTRMAITTNFAAPFTAFVVATMSGSAHQRVFSTHSGIGNNWLLGWWNGARQQAFFNGVVNLTGSPSADTTWRQYCGRSDGSIGSVYENGSLIASSGSGTAGPNQVRLGGDPQASEFSDCDIAKILIYPSNFTSPQIAQNVAFLAGKYGI